LRRIDFVIALSNQPDALIRQEPAILRSQSDVTPALVLEDSYVLDFLGLTDRFWSGIGCLYIHTTDYPLRTSAPDTPESKSM
jgi:hypothetical protein